MKFSIVIPAYNEEKAIAAIIERCLEERENIIQNTNVNDVEIIVVDDGSVDRTSEIARSYKEIKVISYEKNRGYGAAIKTGFGAASGDLLGFLDADGTCDPEYFIGMIKELKKQDADIAIGSRMWPGTQMPKLRRLGNRIFARMVNLLGDIRITDSASGIRVLKKESLQRIYPLPDGLHFTPAMSTRAVLDPGLRIVEIPMMYRERVGKSKLSVFQDGLKFANAILEIGMTYKPLKFFGSLGILLILIGLILCIRPVGYYITHHGVEEFMIYRFVTIIVLFIGGIGLITAGTLTEYIVEVMNDYPSNKKSILRKMPGNLPISQLFIMSILFFIGAIILNHETIKQYMTTGKIYVHWAYVVIGALFVLTSIQLFSFGLLKRIISLLKEKRDTLKSTSP